MIDGVNELGDLKMIIVNVDSSNNPVVAAEVLPLNPSSQVKDRNQQRFDENEIYDSLCADNSHLAGTKLIQGALASNMLLVFESILLN